MKSPAFVRLLQGTGINSRCAIETKPSSLTGVSELLKSSGSGEYWLPTRIATRKWVSKWRVTHHAIPRLTLAWCVLDIALAVELAEQFALLAPNDVQLMPIELDWGKKNPRKDIRYCYVNIHREIDCVNMAETKVINASDPDVLRMKDSDNALVLDPNRIPSSVQAFHPKYLCSEIVISKKLGAALMKLAPGTFECQPIKMLREESRSRSALITALL
ncbi:MAG: hypothetical protein KGS45_11680 [Planctomycetes bacterium]|nr:hypothetical protein [Planctomycetota bacterium]